MSLIGTFLRFRHRWPEDKESCVTGRAHDMTPESWDLRLAF